MARSDTVRVSVVYAPAARQLSEVFLDLPAPCQVWQALQRSGLLARYPELAMAPVMVGVWGRKVPLSHMLREDDRIELYRTLRVDPKVARRERFATQGVRAAGLFVIRPKRAKTG